MKDLFFKSFLPLILSSFCLGFCLSCNNSKTSVGKKPLLAPTTQGAAFPAIGYVYGNQFRVQNSSAYQTLLEACRRCGTRRYFTNPGGVTTYERSWNWGSGLDLKKCKNWNSDGFIQIEFAKKALPTEATVTIQPKYTGIDFWGTPFVIKAIAKPINENKGFQILLNPVDGLGGSASLSIKSDYSNHVLQGSLDVQVTYGQQESQTIIIQTLTKREKTEITEIPLSCQTYTN